MVSPVTAVPAAPWADALRHFLACLSFETDCADVHAALAMGNLDFVLLDVRAAADFLAGHVHGAISMPHATITESTLASFAPDAVFVVYCAGPHCNGAHRAAVRLASLGRSVKIMIGGIAGWRDEGFELEVGRT